MSDQCKEVEFIKKKADAYHFLGCQDRHIVTLIDWIDKFETIKSEVDEDEGNLELSKQIHEIISKLIKEVGFRITLIFP